MLKKDNDSLGIFLPLLRELEKRLPLTEVKIKKLQKKYALKDGSMLSKTDIIAAYKEFAGKHGLKPFEKKVINQLQMKPVRTSSGLAPVTVLTKPYPCPGNCIFCPSDVRMPKSYLASEPGAQRAEHNYFDPYLQTYNRLQALHDMGHPVDKIELIVLGGSWSVYLQTYQIWFIKECFRAMNEFKKNDDRKRLKKYYQQIFKEIAELDFPSFSSDSNKNEQVYSQYQPQGLLAEKKTYNNLINELFTEPEKRVGLDKFQTAQWSDLFNQHELNQRAEHRCVGLVLETRPDLINKQEIIYLRKFGCTKVQLGVQSLSDQILKKNQRGHSVAQTASAIKLLRQAGFKLHIHWMPNLYGSTAKKDKKDYQKLFQDPRFKPDEVKIYPCSLIESAPLMRYYLQKKWQPYTYDELLDVLTFALANTPQYCRITRVIRDIPSFEIVSGNKKTNFRQLVQEKLDRTGLKSVDIRAREIRDQKFDSSLIYLDKIKYETNGSQEVFLQFLVPVKKENSQLTDKSVVKLLGFLRLSLPEKNDFTKQIMAKNCAIIREVHVYGQLVSLGQDSQGRAQHLGLGTKLIKQAAKIAQQQGYEKLAVISAVGTREYYRHRGFKDSKLYQILDLN